MLISFPSLIWSNPQTKYLNFGQCIMRSWLISTATATCVYITKRSQHSVHMLTGPLLQQQQQNYKTTQTSRTNWAATFKFCIGKSF